MPSDDHIIGFDVRVPRGDDNPWFPEYLLKETGGTVVSIDPMVLPVPHDEAIRRSKRDAIPRENFLGLLTSPQLKPMMEPTAFEIAAAVGAHVYKTLVEKMGALLTTTTLTTGADLASNGWILLGYDVIDVNGLISGLLNCGPNSPEFKLRFAPCINKCSLFDDDAAAEAYAKMRDAQIPSHSPFRPASIWKKPEIASTLQSQSDPAQL
jgi:hypothetical protein